MAYRTTNHTPYELLYGRKMSTLLESTLKITEDTIIYNNHLENLRSNLKEAYEKTKIYQDKLCLKQRKQYNKNTKQNTFKIS